MSNSQIHLTQIPEGTWKTETLPCGTMVQVETFGRKKPHTSPRRVLLDGTEIGTVAFPGWHRFTTVDLAGNEVTVTNLPAALIYLVAMFREVPELEPALLPLLVTDPDGQSFLVQPDGTRELVGSRWLSQDEVAATLRSRGVEFEVQQ